jgi:hypothetical protein
MQTVYVGNTLINDVMLGSQRMDDVIAQLQPLNIQYLIVGNGGTAGTSVEGGRGGGNGGAGGLLSGSFIALPFQTSLSAVVGSVGSPNSSFYSLTALGGGSGGNAGGGSQNGTTGGSGGGAAGSGTAGSGTAGQGFGGGSAAGGATGAGGGGGGASAAGDFGGQNANGVTWLDGIYYAQGGAGNSTPNRGHGGIPSATGDRTGSSGIVKLRYYGQPVATGGTITQSGGYTYHTFTTSGTFTY